MDWEVLEPNGLEHAMKEKKRAHCGLDDNRMRIGYHPIKKCAKCVQILLDLRVPVVLIECGFDDRE